MSIQPFIGRQEELAKLREFIKDDGGARMTALFGRRRVGKTRLVKEAFKDVSLYHFEGIEGQHSEEQRKHFIKTLYRHTSKEAHRLARSDDWEDLLILLAEHIGQEKCVVFFDEFQWMAANRTQLIGKLKYVWDNYFAEKSNVHLILCGSVSSFIVKKVVRSKALYGRIDNIIELEALSFPEVRHGPFKKRSVTEALEYYLIFGGIPKYFELYNKSSSLKLNLENLCFKKRAFFQDEFSRIFITHFGKTGHYKEVVEHLANESFDTRNGLLEKLSLKSGGRLSTILDELEMAGFIEAYGSVHRPGSRTQRYRISDPFIRFHFKYIVPAQEQIKSGRKVVPLHMALPEQSYRVFLGLAFEQFCQKHAHLIATKLGFSAVKYTAGAWFKRGKQNKSAQIDLLFKRADKVLTLVEVKFREKVDKKVIGQVEDKIEVLREESDYSIEPILLTVKKPDKSLYEEGYFSRILTIDDLL